MTLPQKEEVYPQQIKKWNKGAFKSNDREELNPSSRVSKREEIEENDLKFAEVTFNKNQAAKLQEEIKYGNMNTFED